MLSQCFKLLDPSIGFPEPRPATNRMTAHFTHLYFVAFFCAFQVVECDQKVSFHRQRGFTHHSAAHEWACSLFNNTLARMSAFVITGSNVIDTRGKAVRETWGSAFQEHRLFMFTDGDNLANSSMNVVTLPGTSNSHEGSQKKWPLAFDHFCKTTDEATQEVRAATDWLLVADDDTYVFLHNLLPALSPFSIHWPYAIGRRQLEEGVDYLSGGAGYVLSRAAIDRICERVDTFVSNHWRSYYSDINMGLFLSSLNITTVPMDGFYPTFGAKDVSRNPDGLRRAPDLSAFIMEMEVPYPLTYHYVPPNQMLSLHERVRTSVQNILDACRRA